MSLPHTRRPDRGRCWARLRASAPPEWVLRHSLAVEGLAVALAERAEAAGEPVDLGLVHGGALLHDLGRSVVQDVRHASVGASMLQEEDWDPMLVRIVERHTGGGIEPKEAAALGLPVKDYTPQTLEEKLVCHADNLHSGDKRLRVSEVEAKYEKRDLLVAAGKILALHDELRQRIGADPDDVEPAVLPEP